MIAIFQDTKTYRPGHNELLFKSFPQTPEHNYQENYYQFNSQFHTMNEFKFNVCAHLTNYSPPTTSLCGERVGEGKREMQVKKRDTEREIS